MRGLLLGVLGRSREREKERERGRKRGRIGRESDDEERVHGMEFVFGWEGEVFFSFSLFVCLFGTRRDLLVWVWGKGVMNDEEG